MRLKKRPTYYDMLWELNDLLPEACAQARKELKREAKGKAKRKAKAEGKGNV